MMVETLRLDVKTNPLILIIDESIPKITNEFLTNCHVKKLSKNTIQYYKDELGYLWNWLYPIGVESIRDFTADLLRRYLLQLATHRNQGGVHASYRVIRVFCNFYILEYDVTDWVNPCSKVKPKQPKIQPIDGTPFEAIPLLLSACLCTRDKALILLMTDSGLRAAEVCNLNVIDAGNDGAVRVLHGKGNKARVSFIGKKTMRALRAYLKTRKELRSDSPLFTVTDGSRLSTKSLTLILRRLAKRAGIPFYSPHDFRRLFARQFIINGGSVMALKELLGHSDLKTTQRYVALTAVDLRLGYSSAMDAQ